MENKKGAIQLEINDIVSYKNPSGHLLYGRITGMSDKATTLRIFGLSGRSAVRRVHHSHKIAKQVLHQSYNAMIEHNLHAGERAKASRSVVKKLQQDRREKFRELDLNGRPNLFDAAERLAQEACH